MFQLKRLLIIPATVLALTVSVFAAKKDPKQVIKDPSEKPGNSTPLQFTMKDIDGKDFKLADLKGKVVMFVNVASKCGNTPQYASLEAAYEKYKDKGFMIIGVPANDFGAQEPGSDAEIKKFCTSKYNVSFKMLSKVSVVGNDKSPLYKYLTEKETAGEFAGEIEWNFTKFLVDRNGNLVARFAHKTKPDDAQVTGEIEKALKATAAK